MSRASKRSTSALPRYQDAVKTVGDGGGGAGYVITNKRLISREGRFCPLLGGLKRYTFWDKRYTFNSLSHSALPSGKSGSITFTSS
jgi:hypothetical protein